MVHELLSLGQSSEHAIKWAAVTLHIGGSDTVSTLSLTTYRLYASQMRCAPNLVFLSDGILY